MPYANFSYNIFRVVRHLVSLQRVPPKATTRVELISPPLMEGLFGFYSITRLHLHLVIVACHL